MVYCTWKTLKKYYKNNVFKVSAPTWKYEFKLSDGRSFGKKHEKITTNPPIQIYLNEVHDRMTCQIKLRYVFELLMPEATKLLQSTGKKIHK